ncbi:DUF443 domain-containing protein [Salipaludibacillus sp. LMS25]|uniref:DUF443 family protein n=1 Tax=Salipaludibacillus sp. LMS25 TaxID=2924031 RepID=UPI0020D1430C|nr:DUF443 family protein [Salipaludibacillus sp. LMS25]UTR13809.1 DUF443 domain-containing protein [Salipaludibacillus sp. LMS25]
MTSEIKRIRKNMTYRIVTIDGEHYLMDTGTPVWKGLFPYSFWLFSHPGYKLDDDKVLDAAEESGDGLWKTLALGSVGGGTAFFLTPLMEYLNIPTSSFINFLILFLVLTVVLFTRVYYSNLNKAKLDRIVDLKKLKVAKLRIRPSMSYLVMYTILYVLLLAITIFIFIGFIETGNAVALLCSMFLFFFVLIINTGNVIPDKTYGKLANQK